MPPTWRPATPEEIATLDSAAASDPRSGFMQSSWWAEFKHQEGYETTRLVCEEVGSALLLHYPYGRELGGQGAGFVVCPEGPVLPWHDQELSRAALRSLTEHVRGMPEALGLRIEPHLEPPTPTILRNWAKSPTDLTPLDTLTLDLTKTDEELLAAMRPKCRYNLRVAERHGVQIESSTSMDLVHQFHELLTKTAERDDFFAEPLGFFIGLCQTLFRVGAGEFLTAKYQDETLAMILVVHFGLRSTYLYGASSDRHRNVMPTYPLHWAAIQSARSKGSQEYDFYGIDAIGRRDHLYAGITRFKKQWGGSVKRRIGARDYIFYDRLADAMVAGLATTGL